MRSQFWVRGGEQAGVTLVEVLVAIFISGIGLLALLALFPLGMLNMAQAIRDDRQSQLQDVADDLAAESQRIDQSVGQLRSVYTQWLQQRFADPKQHQTLLQIVREHDRELARIAQKVQVRLPQLKRSDRRRAREVLRLLGEGRHLLAALERNLVLVGNLQNALNQQANANNP